MGGLLLSVLQLAGFGKLRLLSLYISFTDEFMQQQPAGDGQDSPGGTGR